MYDGTPTSICQLWVNWLEFLSLLRIPYDNLSEVIDNRVRSKVQHIIQSL